MAFSSKLDSAGTATQESETHRQLNCRNRWGLCYL